MGIVNSGGRTKSIQFLRVKLNTVSRHNFVNILYVLCLNIELDVNGFGSRINKYLEQE